MRRGRSPATDSARSSPAFTSTPTSTPPPSGPVIITYAYDPLYRLTEANYSNGNYYHYAYDAVGNRLSQTTQLAVNSYQYDVANRLTSVDGVAYTWDNNGNLLNDGVNTYAYDSANRLTSISGGQTATYAYNGLGDRLSQNGVNYTLDLNAGLTQVLNDGTNQYLYGAGRIAQVNATTEYFLGDALGSVRQLTNGQEQVTLANAYEPYGNLAQTAGSAQTSYGFTGEQTDPSGMVYLRARYYMPNDGRFLTRDRWMGDYNRPLSLNRWGYVEGNPINLSDHSGHSPHVDCTLWDWYFRSFCERANGNDKDRSVLDAREQLFYAIATGGYGQYWKSGGAYGSAEGYAWAANLLLHFLNGSGSHLNIYLGSNDPFVNDPYITRATKRFATQSIDDEADVIRPLLYDFISNHVKRAATADGNRFQTGPVKLYGSEHYFNRPGKEFGLEPRAYDRGYWAAFGHVTIDGSFSANGYYRCSDNNYLVTYTVNYSIEDRYEWFENKWTPFPFGPGGNTVQIPHEWELSLVADGRAKMFDFTVSWNENERILVASSFTSWTNAPWWTW